MQQDERQSSGQQPSIDDLTAWLDKATPDDKITAAKLALTHVESLDQVHRQRFFSEVDRDPAIRRLFEDLKATA